MAALTSQAVSPAYCATSGVTDDANTNVATIITFEVPGAFTSAYGINDSGTVVGDYDGYGFGGFVRSPKGSIHTFTIPGSFYVPPFAINNSGTVTGYYSDANGIFHGFVRGAGGALQLFDVPSPDSGLAETLQFAINADG
jgi:uncharacterized membrane protein